MAVSKRDKARRKALIKVFPAFMVKRMEAGLRRQDNPGGRSSPTNDEEDSEEDGRTPNKIDIRSSGRTRIVPVPRGRLEIQGDPESSDVEPEAPPLPRLSEGFDRFGDEDLGYSGGEAHYDSWADDHGQNDFGGDGQNGDSDHASLLDDRIASSEESEGSDDEVVDLENVENWLDHRSPSPHGLERGGEANVPRAAASFREGDLIDRMLQRHVNLSTKRRRNAKTTTNKLKRRRVPKDQSTLSDFQRPMDAPSGHRDRTSSSRSKGIGKQDMKQRPRHPKIHLDLTRGGKPSSSTSRPRSGGFPRHRAREQQVSITMRDCPSKLSAKRGKEPIVISDDENVARTSPPPLRDNSEVPYDLADLLRPDHGTGPTAVGASHLSQLWTEFAPLPSEQRKQVQSSRGAQVGAYAAALSRKSARDGLIDFGLPSLPNSASFASTTYIGSGHLASLLGLLTFKDPASIPSSIGDLSPTMDVAELEDHLPVMFDGIYEWALHQSQPTTEPRTTIPRTMRFLCEYMSWKASLHSTDPNSILKLVTLVQEQIQHLFARLEVARDLRVDDDRVIWVYWFSVEMSLRLTHPRMVIDGMDAELVRPTGNVLTGATPTRQYWRALISRLLRKSFVGFLSFPDTRREDEVSTPDNLESAVAEVWVCSLHVADCLAGRDSSEQALVTGQSIWAHVMLSLQESSDQDAVAGLEASERLWRAILTIIILTPFTCRGIVTSKRVSSAHWPVVQLALGLVRLDADPSKDAKTMAGVLQRRDAYMRLILARCLLLVTRWKWDLCGGDALFKTLTAIFRTRKFENLRGESSDFPLFLRDLDDNAYLEDYDRKETSFGIFLRLILHAANHYERDSQGSAFATKQRRKLASLVFPIGATPFNKENPPVGRELSMLFNRLAAVVATINLEPANAKFRIQQARRFLDFGNADADSRSAVIRGMMLIAVVHRRKGIELDEIMSWYSDMIKILLVELKDVEATRGVTAGPQQSGTRAGIAILVLQLVAALRKVIECSTPTGHRKYPDPILIERGELSPCRGVEVFAYPNLHLYILASLDEVMSASLADDLRTSGEIRKLIQAFLDTRNMAMPKRQVQPMIAGPEESESQQSDEFGDWGVDWDDPRLKVALGEGEKTGEMLMEERVAAVS